MKKILIKILRFIRRILTALKNHCSPPLSLALYEMYEKEEIKKCYETFKPHFQKSIFLDYIDYRKFIIERAKENDKYNKKFYLEFGVWVGKSINFFSKYVNTIYGFDSFEGLPEAWSGSGQSKGAFSLGGKLPRVAPNVVLHKGWFSETAVDFFNLQQDNLAFAHLDADLYNATLEALNAMTAKAKTGSLLLFDEYFGQIAWREHEHKAFGEWLENNKLEAECLAWVSNGAVLFRLK